MQNVATPYNTLQFSRLAPENDFCELTLESYLCTIKIATKVQVHDFASELSRILYIEFCEVTLENCISELTP